MFCPENNKFENKHMENYMSVLNLFAGPGGLVSNFINRLSY